MKPFDIFDSFYLPSQTSKPIVPRHFIYQINLFSGTIFIRDYQTYQDLCKVLKLHFDRLETKPSSGDGIVIRDVVDLTFFVFDSSTRVELGMDQAGFKESPVPFLRKLLTIRRHGQGLGPSHMGKLVHGMKLNEEDFDNDIYKVG